MTECFDSGDETGRPEKSSAGTKLIKKGILWYFEAEGRIIHRLMRIRGLQRYDPD